MCVRERLSLQAGMTFRPPPNASIFLMSRRPNAPYEDVLSVDGLELEYEGHDVSSKLAPDPKKVNQPRFLPSGKLTQNGKFAEAIDNAPEASPPRVRVYEKMKDGIWSDRGLFELVGYTTPFKATEGRKVFKFKMRHSSHEDLGFVPGMRDEFKRIIPSWVKQEVFKRDRGQCVLCGAKDELHFDHELPFVRGGTGLAPENVRILCARHNLAKGGRIE